MFAMNAPAEIPNWFKLPKPPKGEAPDLEKFNLTPDEKILVRRFCRGEIQYLPFNLRQLELELRACFTASTIRQMDEDPQTRFFAWRWYYAKKMLEAMPTDSMVQFKQEEAA